MRGWKMLVMVVACAAVATPVLAAPMPQATRGPAAVGTIQYGSIQGRVTAVDLTAKTIGVMPAEGWGTGSMRVDLTGQTRIHQGIMPRKASDLKVGQHVDVMYSGPRDKWVADEVDVLDPSVAEAHYHGMR